MREEKEKREWRIQTGNGKRGLDQIEHWAILDKTVKRTGYNLILSPQQCTLNNAILVTRKTEFAHFSKPVWH